METEGGDAKWVTWLTQGLPQDSRCRRSWVLGGLHMANNQVDKVMEEKSMEVC